MLMRVAGARRGAGPRIQAYSAVPSAVTSAAEAVRVALASAWTLSRQTR
jgi:hypothetical protein